MSMNILLLCIGNLCRSPMAEGLLRKSLPLHELFSAGICAQDGAPAHPLAVELMWQLDIDISEHRARQLSRWMMREADLVLTMERAQQQFVQRRFPSVAHKVEQLAAPGGIDIPDPYGRGLPAFQLALQLIRAAVRERVPQLHVRSAAPLEPRCTGVNV